MNLPSFRFPPSKLLPFFRIPHSAAIVLLLCSPPLTAQEPEETATGPEPSKKVKIEVVQPDNFRLNLVMIRDGETLADIKVAEAGKRFFLEIGKPWITMTASLKFVDAESSQLLIEYSFSYQAPLRTKIDSVKDPEAKGKELDGGAINLSGSVKVIPNKPVVFYSDHSTELSLTLLQTGDFAGTSSSSGKGVPNNRPRPVGLPPRPAKAPQPVPPQIQALINAANAQKANDAANKAVPRRRVVLPPTRK